jgi:HAD superfamily phosphoserine phosphatase-like hydrolase
MRFESDTTGGASPRGPLGASPTGPAPYLRAPEWDPEVREALEAMVRRGGPGAVAALDFDQTVVYGDVSETLLRLLDERDGGSRTEAYHAACRVDRYRAYVDLVGTLIGGRTEPEARALALWTLEVGESRGELGYREPMRELIWALHRHGWEVWIVTASPEVLVQALAERVGVAPGRVLGMRPPLEAGGRYSQTVDGPITYLDGKLTALRAAAAADPTFVVGDSTGDLAMMEASRHVLLLDHGDAELTARAHQNGWWIQPGGRIR